MKITVTVIGRSQFDDAAFLSFLKNQRLSWRRSTNVTPSDEAVEAAGRVCYMSFGDNQSPRSNQDYIRHLIRMGHESVLEHVSWTFLLTGVSRAFTHQLVRHRVGFAFSQLSQQYHNESKAEFVRPSIIKSYPGAQKIWEEAVTSAKCAYGEILDSLAGLEETGLPGFAKKELRRAIRSAARSVLPNATETKLVMTANARALRYFFRIRGSIVGDEEMRNVAAALLKRVRSEAPSIFSDFRIRKLSDRSPIVECEVK